MGLIDDVGPGPIAVDTVAFIYFIEEHRRYVEILEPLFRAVAAGSHTMVTSAITLLEVLVVPYRAGDFTMADRYEALLSRGQGLELVPINGEQLRAAALLRARLRIQPPDALQVAAAISRGCPCLVTNDRGLPEVEGLRVLQLRDYLR